MDARHGPGTPIVLQPGEGEVIGDTPDRRVEILSDDESLNATWSRFGPRGNGADLHVHRHHSDLFYDDGLAAVRAAFDQEPAERDT